MSQQSQFLSDITPLIPSGQAATPITVTQTLGDSAKGEVLLQHSGGPQTVYIQVNGPQTSLTEDDISGVYPAPGSSNSPDNYLPHIALKRRTLPWERTGPLNAKTWLWVVLLKSSEMEANPSSAPVQNISRVGREATLRPVATEIISPKGIVTSAALADPVRWVRPGPSVVTGTVGDVKSRDTLGYNSMRSTNLADTAPVNLLFLQNSTLTALLPVKGQPDLTLLCNAKRTNNGNGDVDCSVIIGNRLPDASLASPELHTAFLVSVEKRDDLYDPTRTSSPNNETALIVLHSWSFTPSRGGDFEEVMRAIRIEPNGGVMRFGNLPHAPALGETGPLTAGFDALLDHNGLFLQPLDHTQAGKVAYRGPLRPFPTAPRSAGFAIRSAPEEFTDATADTPLDYSHAAAFELGKLLAVGSHDILDDLREVHGVVNVIDPQVATSSLPIALQKRDWVVDPAWGDEPWAMPLANNIGEVVGSVSMAQNAQNLIGVSPADVSGVSAQLQQFATLAGTLTVLETPAALQINSIDIVNVLAIDLAKQFPVAFATVQG